MGTVSNLSMLPARIIAKIRIDEKTGCWLWIGYIEKGGYGRGTQVPDSKGRRGRTCLAHRLVWELLVGPIPVGMVLDHRCRVRLCVNPAHLEPVTLAENSRRIRSVGLPNVNGLCRTGKHPWIPANIYIAPSGVMQCRCCRAERQRRFGSAGKYRKARPGPGQAPLL